MIELEFQKRMLGFEEAITFLASFTFVWLEVSRTSTGKFRKYYERNIGRITPPVPSWVFGTVWKVLKICIALALFYFLRHQANVSVTIFALWIINEVLRKYWTYFFRDMQMPRTAFFICLGIFGTGLGLLILLGIDKMWISFGLMVPYVVWVSVACIWNYQWVWSKTSDKENPLLSKSSVSSSSFSIRQSKLR